MIKKYLKEKYNINLKQNKKNNPWLDSDFVAELNLETTSFLDRKVLMSFNKFEKLNQNNYLELFFQTVSSAKNVAYIITNSIDFKIKSNLLNLCSKYNIGLILENGDILSKPSYNKQFKSN